MYVFIYSFYIPVVALIPPFLPVQPSQTPLTIIPFFSPQRWGEGQEGAMGTKLPWHIKSQQDQVYSLPLRPDKAAQVIQ